MTLVCLRDLLADVVAHVGFMGVAMAPFIFTAMGFLSCWFLLYALMEWAQDKRHREH
jgi:hypothetical protein